MAFARVTAGHVGLLLKFSLAALGVGRVSLAAPDPKLVGSRV
jgi:hypothetical protein